MTNTHTAHLFMSIFSLQEVNLDTRLSLLQSLTFLFPPGTAQRPAEVGQSQDGQQESPSCSTAAHL